MEPSDRVFTEIYRTICGKNTKILVKNDPNSDQVIHGNQFFLVDKDGVLVKMYNGYAENIEDVPIDTIASDIETYIDENL